MFGNGFGNFGNGGLGGSDFESLARQYWNAWGEAMRQGAAGAGLPGANQPGWQQATQWWSQLLPGVQPDAMGAVHRFNQLASGWFGQMQQVAAQFAGQNGSAADIARAWREALGADDANANPFADLFRSMQSGGQESLNNWLEQAAPYIQALQTVAQGDPSRWLHVPTFGLAREHQERWQALLQAQQDYQQRNKDYNALMLKMLQHALSLFEDKLAEHEEPGRQLTTARALFDLWIDAAEDAYAQVALSEPFREVYGALTNAQMRLRSSVQVEIEKISGLFGMPTRTEIDSAHRKIVQLERAMRQQAREPKPRAAVRRQPAAVAEPVQPPAPAAQAEKPKAAAKKPAKKAAKAVPAKATKKKAVRRRSAAKQAKPVASAKPRSK
ncbi:MAG TPA: class III poly(R)-hydroxyalkanoic acid synthase subunit PhaE, partial [Pseudoxanthomonas sp.]|nr:class III poly(R)-hydroxyalkanoic acid synthase subunit PhaE [Pseudoxanthomonas sp.]